MNPGTASGAHGSAGAGHPEFDSGDAGGVDAMQDSGHFARFGEPQPQNRGVHAGEYHAIHRVQGGHGE